MPDSRCGVLGVKGLTSSPPNILLLIVTKQLNVCFMWPQSFPPEGFHFVPVISSKLQSSFKVPCLDQELLSNTAASQSCWCETHLTVDTGSCLPAASKSLHNCFWWFLVDSWPSWPVFCAMYFILTNSCCIQLLILTLYLYKSTWACCWEPSSQHNAAATMLHNGDGVFVLMCSVWCLPNAAHQSSLVWWSKSSHQFSSENFI